ncbi:hypothetical protein N806_02845 [Rhodococcus sp. P27]|nr:hypothetical protein N806_02845 [Rhodococcus sp. P27]
MPRWRRRELLLFALFLIAAIEQITFEFRMCVEHLAVEQGCDIADGGADHGKGGANDLG